MNSRKTRRLAALFAVVVATMAMAPFAAAQAGASAQASAKKGSAAKQIKALKAQSAALRRETAALREQVAALAAKVNSIASPSGAAPVSVPTALPPNGPAGGDLAGIFPKPQIAPNAITGAKVANESLNGLDIAPGAISGLNLGPGSVDGSKIIDGSVGQQDLAAGIVGSRQLGAVIPELGDMVPIDANQFEEVTVTCPAGTRLLSGGWEWSNQNASGTSIIFSSPSFPQGGTRTWEVRGRAGSADNLLRATALCLRLN